MSVLWPKAWPYQRVGYVDEADLENAILKVEDGQRNIPDSIFLT
jgi:hypothetical protein